jgi:hypothetical protein
MTHWLQSTTKRTKEDTIANDQITGNNISVNVVNHDSIIPCFDKADDIHETCKIIKGIYLFKDIKSKEKYHKGHYFY